MNTINIGVFRIFGNELEQPVNDDDVALQLHNNRKEALHDIFDHQTDVEVKDWGYTDDTHPHEFIMIVAGMASTTLVNYVVIPAAKKIFEKLADKAIDTVFEKSFSWILSRVFNKQEEKKIGRVEITLPNGIVLFVEKGDTVEFSVNGKRETVKISGN